MIADRNQLVTEWANFQSRIGGIRMPANEAEYLELRDLMEYLIFNHDCDIEPYLSLLHLVGTYMMEWERLYEEPIEEASGGDVLRSLMEEHGVSQMQLEREGIADQGLLSKILSGKRQISKRLAKRLGERFKISPAVFL